MQVLQLILDTERRSRSSSFRPPSAPSSAAGSAASKPAASVIVTASEVPIRLIPSITDHRPPLLLTSNRCSPHQTVRPKPSSGQIRRCPRPLSSKIPFATGTDAPALSSSPRAGQAVGYSEREQKWRSRRRVDLPRDVFTEHLQAHVRPDQIKANIDGLYGDAAMRAGSYNYYSYTSSRGARHQDEELVKSSPIPQQQISPPKK